MGYPTYPSLCKNNLLFAVNEHSHIHRPHLGTPPSRTRGRNHRDELVFRAFRNRSNFRVAPRQSFTAASHVLSEVPPSGPSSHVAMEDIMSLVVTPSCTPALWNCVTSATAAACSAVAAGPCTPRKHALAARIARVEAGGAPRAHAHRGRSTC